ncbi:uncharacterized protein [Henckelia pumila]|uniref:uncharacterized protein n=1 Tax=Henckelia pumila TaxID=405737 RepID=UPI003C6E5ED6
MQFRRPPPTEYCVEDEPKMIVFSHLTPERRRKVLRSSAVSTPFHAPMYGTNTALQGQEFEKRYLLRVRRDWPKVEMEKRKLRAKQKHGKYDRNFFHTLMTPEQWLEYDHMTECIRGLLSLQKLYPEILAENVSLMNVNFAQLFQIEYSSMDKPIDVEQLTSHITGCVEDWPSSSWWSSNISATTRSNFDKAVKGVISLVPETLRSLDFEGAERRWTCVRLCAFPQQKTSGECGLYALRSIAAEMSNGDPYQLNDDVIADFRKFLTTAIWLNDWSLPAIDKI